MPFIDGRFLKVIDLNRNEKFAIRTNGSVSTTKKSEIG